MKFVEERKAVLVWSAFGEELFFVAVDKLTPDWFKDLCKQWGAPKGVVRKDIYCKSF